MDTTIAVAFISALIPALASIFVCVSQTNRTIAILEERDAMMKEQLVDLKNKVEAHNNFGLQLAKLETRVNALEQKQ